MFKYLILVLVILVISCGNYTDLSKSIVKKTRISNDDYNCYYYTDLNGNSDPFVAPCDCFNVDDIPVEKIKRK